MNALGAALFVFPEVYGMGTLWDLAQEYRKNQLPIERRLEDLRNELSHTASQEANRRLRHRINVLEKMLADSQRYIFEMEHYYDGKG